MQTLSKRDDKDKHTVARTKAMKLRRQTDKKMARKVRHRKDRKG